jgi:S-layer homology domain.
MNHSRIATAAAALGVLTLSLAVSPAARAQAGSFPDVPKNHWAAESVTRLAGAGILKGYAGGPLAVAQGKPPAKKPAYDGNKPVTRYELAVTLYRFVVYMERAERQKKSSTGAWLQGEPKSGAEAVKKLIAMGYLPQNTPLATEGDKLVTADQLADALAMVIAKTQEKKTPISKGSRKDIEKPNVGI